MHSVEAVRLNLRLATARTSPSAVSAWVHSAQIGNFRLKTGARMSHMVAAPSRSQFLEAGISTTIDSQSARLRLGGLLEPILLQP
jgi:hypothetical protein